jgi:hypothetical protein
MEIHIVVSDPTQEESISPSELKYDHSGCGSMSLRRVMPGRNRELRCDCGVRVVVLDEGPGPTLISRLAVDGLPVRLPPESVQTSATGSVRMTWNHFREP